MWAREYESCVTTVLTSPLPSPPPPAGWCTSCIVPPNSSFLVRKSSFWLLKNVGQPWFLNFIINGKPVGALRLFKWIEGVIISRRQIGALRWMIKMFLVASVCNTSTTVPRCLGMCTITVQQDCYLIALSFLSVRSFHKLLVESWCFHLRAKPAFYCEYQQISLPLLKQSLLRRVVEQ